MCLAARRRSVGRRGGVYGRLGVPPRCFLFMETLLSRGLLVFMTPRSRDTPARRFSEHESKKNSHKVDLASSIHTMLRVHVLWVRR